MQARVQSNAQIVAHARRGKFNSTQFQMTDVPISAEQKQCRHHCDGNEIVMQKMRCQMPERRYALI